MSSGIASLDEPLAAKDHGGKAARLAAARRAGLPVPPGLALSAEVVDRLARRDEVEPLAARIEGSLRFPLAVRSPLTTTSSPAMAMCFRASPAPRSSRSCRRRRAARPPAANRARSYASRHGELRRLAELGARCEEVFGGPQDIEWAFAGGRLHLLQSRPFTTLSKPRREDSKLHLQP